MSSQNINSLNELKNYFRVQGCANNDQLIFKDEADYRSILSIFIMYFSNDNISGVEIIAYCFAPNNFDILLCQKGDGQVAKFMSIIIVAYNKYYFEKYQDKDLLSESDLKTSEVIVSDLADASRDIHTCATDWLDYPNSSIRAYLYDDTPNWLNKSYVINPFGSAEKYLEFLQAKN